MSIINNFVNAVKGLWWKMIGNSEIKKIFAVEPVISEEMRTAIQRWSAIYGDSAEWLSDTVRSLHLGSTLPREIARSVTIELQTDFNNTARAKWLESQFKQVMSHLRDDVEYALAGGGFVWKPYLDGDTLAIDRVQADAIYPIKFAPSGEMNAVLFQYQQSVNGKFYTRLEYHDASTGTYTIKNLFYRSDSRDSLGNPINILNVPVEEWKTLEAEATIEGAPWLLMSYMKAPGANPVDPASPLGVSVFSRAENLIQNADEQYGLTMWEYQTGKRRMFFDEQALYRENGTTEFTADLNKGVYVALKGTGNIGNNTLITEHNPIMRDANFWMGLNSIKRQIEFACGVAYGTISDTSVEARTATEIAMQKQRSYSTIKDIQNALEASMRRLLDVMNWWASANNLAPNADYAVEFDFDDSIITDIAAERVQWLEELAQGLRSKAEYRQHFYGESPEAAATALAAIESTAPNLAGLLGQSA